MSAIPAVSVCIPARNASRYLPAAIESVLAQEFGDFELVVCDNASTDDTPEICARYDDNRLRVVRYEESVGQAANWNRCLDLACGKYVVLLHADDELLPGFLARATQLLDANEDVGLLHCTVQHVDERGNPLALQRLFIEDRVDRDGEVLRRLLLDGCVINPAGVMVRRGAYEAAGKFTERVVWGVDWHMWIRIAIDWPVAYFSQPRALYRQHTQSGTSNVLANARNGSDEAWVIDDLFRTVRAQHPDLYDLRKAAVRGVAHRTWCMAERMCQLGEMRAARKGLRQTIAIRPASLRDPKVWALWAATYVGYDRFTSARWRRERFRRVVRPGK